jgi:hypothetical protein
MLRRCNADSTRTSEIIAMTTSEQRNNRASLVDGAGFEPAMLAALILL